MAKKAAQHAWFGGEFRKLRLAKGKTQKDVQDALGYKSGQFISNWERGISLPPYKAIPKIAGLFQMKRNDLLDMVFKQKAQSLQAERAVVMEKYGAKK